MLDRERLQTEMESLKIQTKKKVYDHMFDEWTLYTAQGYSIFLTGLGMVQFWAHERIVIFSEKFYGFLSHNKAQNSN